MTKVEASQSTALVPVCPVQVPARIADLAQMKNLAEVFGSPKSVFVDQVLAGIQQRTAKEAADIDVSKESGRKALRSIAFSIARAKTAIDAAGKGLNDEKRAEIDAVDAERRTFRARLEEMQDEIKAPAEEWEQAETARVKRLYDRLDAMKVDGSSGDDLIFLRARREWIENVKINESWQEFQAQADEQRLRSLEWLDARIAEVEARDAKDAEMARLQAELDRLRREEAERAAEAERARIAEETARLAKEREEAEARRQEDARLLLEQERAEAAEAARVKAEEAAAAQIAEAERAKMEAEQREREAVAAERKRVFDEEQAAIAARKEREHNAVVRAQVKSDIIDTLLAIMDAAKDAKLGRAEFSGRVADAAMAGEIPHVEVKL